MTATGSLHSSWREVSVAEAPRVLCCVQCVLDRWAHDDLAAPFWRLYWNDRMGADVILPRSREPVRPGEVLLIPPHTVFGTACRGPVGHLYVHFTLGLDRAATPGRLFRHRPGAEERSWLERLASPETGSLEAAFAVQAVINASLVAIPADYWAGRWVDARISEALRRLDSPAGAAEGNAALARAVGMQPQAFIRKFAQATGHTPHRYRLRLRVERAAARLREGRLGLEAIAAEAGFCDRFHFTRVFTRLMGQSPARYRRDATVGDEG